MNTPSLTLVFSVPAPVRRAALAPGHKLCWTLKAEFPAPHGTVFLRYSAPEDGDDQLVVLTPGGVMLQRLTHTSLETTAPKTLRALWLASQEQKGPLLQLNGFRLAFPEGFSGLCSLSDVSETEAKFAWNGLRFVDAPKKSLPDADDFSPPLRLPKPKHGSQTRFSVAVFGGRRYLLRWTKSRAQALLEVAATSGKTLVVHKLDDGFVGAGNTSLSALWLDEKRKRGLVLVTSDSDSVRVHVFTDGFTKLLSAQDFNDSSSSIAATTVEFSRDTRGLLIVSESYSEREGGGHTTDYLWTGRSFEGK